jgi:hypothetical protein
MKFVMTTLTVVLVLVTLILTYTFIASLTLTYNSEGNYFDESSMVVYHKQDIEAYGFFTFVTVILTSLAIYKTKKVFANERLATQST